MTTEAKFICDLGNYGPVLGPTLTTTVLEILLFLLKLSFISLLNLYLLLSFFFSLTTVKQKDEGIDENMSYSEAASYVRMLICVHVRTEQTYNTVCITETCSYISVEVHIRLWRCTHGNRLNTEVSGQ